MVLAKLADYERRFDDVSDERPTGYEPKPVRWIVELDREGRPLSGSLALAFTSQSSGAERKRGKDPSKTMLVPHIGRSSEKDKPKLLTDDDEWVFGVPRKGDVRAKETHQAFLDLLTHCADETRLLEVRAVLRFLRDLPPDTRNHLPSDIAAKELITFRVGGHLVTDLPGVREFWRRHYEERTRVSKRMRGGPRSGKDAGLVAQCLVCREARPIAATHPDISGIPGGAKKLVSFNVDAFESYGLSQSYNAPVCVDCAQAYARGLNRLLAAEETRLRLGNVVYAFWTREPTERLPIMQRMFNAPKPDEVHDLMSAAFRGGAAGTRPEVMRDRANAFYAAAFTSHQGRAVMLSWLETTVGAAAENLARYFRMQSIPPLYRDQQPYFSVYQLAASLLPRRRRRDQAELDSRVCVAIVETALGGGGLADWLLFQSVRRSRAERDVSPARAALIQLTLASQVDSSNGGVEELNMHTRESPACLCGRLLAVLEWAQREAIGNPNTTLVDRFYGSASSAPASVFGTLLRNARAHLGKLRREKRGLYVTIERQLEEILHPLEEFPPVLTLKEQAVFALGYYHQRANRGGGRADAQALESEPETGQ